MAFRRTCVPQTWFSVLMTICLFHRQNRRNGQGKGSHSTDRKVYWRNACTTHSAANSWVDVAPSWCRSWETPCHCTYLLMWLSRRTRSCYSDLCVDRLSRKPFRSNPCSLENIPLLSLKIQQSTLLHYLSPWRINVYSAEDLILGYLDGVTLGNLQDGVGSDVNRIIEVGQSFGLQLNVAKCEIITHAGTVISDHTLAACLFTAVSLEDSILLDSPLFPGPMQDKTWSDLCNDLSRAVERLSPKT